MEPGIGHGCERSTATGIIMKTCFFTAALAAVMLGTPFRSMADLPLVYSAENSNTNFPAPPLPALGQLTFIPPLPDPFAWASNSLGSTRSTNFSDWEHHRFEISAQLQNYEIGTKPVVDPSQVTASYTNGTLTVNVTVGTNTLTLTCAVSLPSGSGPFPAIIGMNSPNGSVNPGLLTSVAKITYLHNQVTTYGSPSVNDPFFKLYPAQNPDNTGQYAAWAWGVSRIIDGLYLVTNTLPIDLNHIGVTGCSYAGKMALFSGALDERVALTIAQESGGGGANSWRYNEDIEPAGTVEDIDNTDYNWFKNSMVQFGGANVSYLPEDHHELDAMVAPRALFVTANPGYIWLGNPSCYVCTKAAELIYNTFGIPDRFGYNIIGGHDHCATTTGIDNDMGAFIDKFLLGQTNVNTLIRDYDSSYSTINYARWYAWWGTGNPIFPSISLSIPAAATKGDGTLAGQGHVSVNQTSTTDLVVNLTSSDTSAVTVPASVIIPAGQSNAVFDLTIIDDSLLDGDRVITNTAAALGYDTGQATITVHDNKTTTLAITIPATATKGAGTLVNAGSVTIGAPAGKNINIPLTSSDPSKLSVPSAVIPAGQTSVVFSLTVLDNTLIDGAQVVTVTAPIANWTDGSASMTIFDYHALPDHFGWSAVPSPQFAGQPFTVTNNAFDTNNYQVNFMLPVTFNAWTPGTAPATNTVLGPPVQPDSLNDGNEYVLGYSFTPNTNLVVTGFRYYFGDQVSLWTDSGALLASRNVTSVPGTWMEAPLTNQVVLLAGVTYRIGVHENAMTYYFDDTLQTSFPNGTVNAYWYSYGNTFPNSPDVVTYYVDCRYSTDVRSVAVSPAVSGNFNYGRWSGNLAVLQPAANVTLQSSIPGHSGQTAPFDVLSAPKLAITALSNAVVLAWPVTPAGFVLQQRADLSAGSTWTAATNSPTVVGNSYLMTNPPTATATFYRLYKP